ncbi:hypothetical protein BpHYR1_022790 [Brachionus plicatilis]|uniref:Uncharacterized protein n=1 Tax=Brachionus plicatilis TaxID=10195 RepID=A0A3M7QKC6_BRAPC|nr:hypothetical protein BpHYR1_022790 [Brachionus plicatilis]
MPRLKFCQTKTCSRKKFFNEFELMPNQYLSKLRINDINGLVIQTASLRQLSKMQIDLAVRNP